MSKLIRASYKLGLVKIKKFNRWYRGRELPELPKQFAGQAELGAMYEHLRKYYVNFDKYKHLLNEAQGK
jgi:hypothetical protein